MKTTAKQLDTSQALQAKVNKQGSINSILQRYKNQTAQFQTAEDEELLQGKFETVQRMELEEEEPVQGKFETAQLATEDEEEPFQRKPNNTGLPDNLKSGIENLSGYSMDDVKVHYNSSQPATLQAHAYAQGTDIHVAPGQEKHLPHEAWHVVQQKQGRVKPTMQLKGTVPVNDDTGLEKEADVMGGKALQAKKMEQTLAVSNLVNPVAQRRVLIAIDDQTRENDTVILTNLKYALDYAGGPVNDFSGTADFSTMEPGEDLMIIEHGAPGFMGENGVDYSGYNAADIVRILLGNGNLQRAVPANIGGITILACNAGTDTDEGADTSLVAGVAAGLHAANLDIVVDGKMGLALTSPAIGERTVNPLRDDDYMGIQAQTVIDHNLNVNPGGDLKDANTIITDHADGDVDIAGMTIEQRAERIAQITAPFYRDLIERSDRAGVLFPEFSGERYALGERSQTYD